MQKEKKKKESLMSPVGIAVWPSLNRPQPAHENSNDKTPSWGTKLKLKESDPAVQAFIADLQRRYDENLTEAESRETPKEKAARLKSKNPELGAELPWKQELDETGNPTGQIILNFKQKTFAIRKSDGERFDFFVTLFDAKGKEIDREKVRIGGGSTIVCAFEPWPWISPLGAGLSLKLQAVQVLERVEYQGRDAAGYGFKARDGFSADETPARDDMQHAGEDDVPTGGSEDDSI